MSLRDPRDYRYARAQRGYHTRAERRHDVHDSMDLLIILWVVVAVLGGFMLGQASSTLTYDARALTTAAPNEIVEAH